VPRDYKKVYDPGKGHYVPISGEYTTVPEAVKILELRSQTAQIARAFPGTALEIMEVRTALRGR